MGTLPPANRAIAAASALVLVAINAIVLIGAGTALPRLQATVRPWIWAAVALSSLSVVANALTTSSAERALWLPVTLFLLVWAGSMPVVVAAAGLGFASAAGPARWAAVAAAAIYLLGVQLPTIAVNIPLDNQLLSVSVASPRAAESHAARRGLEPRGNRWNVRRTVLAVLATLLLLVARSF